jgi:hypothetical protein
MSKKNGRPSEPYRDLVIYEEVELARKLRRPKHPGLKPVPLSWDKAYLVAQWVLHNEYEIHLSLGAIRAAYRRGKKVEDQAVSQGYALLGPPIDLGPVYVRKSELATRKKIYF